MTVAKKLISPGWKLPCVSSNNGWSGVVSDLLAHQGYPSRLTQYAMSSRPSGTQPLNVHSSKYAEFLSLSLSGWGSVAERPDGHRWRARGIRRPRVGLLPSTNRLSEDRGISKHVSNSWLWDFGGSEGNNVNSKLWSLKNFCLAVWIQGRL